MRTFHFIQPFLQQPKVNFEDHFEEAKYTLVYRSLQFTTIILGILGIIFLILMNPVRFWSTFFAFLACFGSFLFLIKKNNYVYASLAMNILCGIIIQFSLYFIPQNPHVIEAMWMVDNIFLAFLSIGKKTGLVFCIIHGISMSVHYSLAFDYQIELLRNYTYGQGEIIGICINIFCAFSVLLYFIWQSIKTNQTAADKLTISSLTLQKQISTIQNQNEEKTVLLKEIHHRVKNNLQLIISLLRLQLREIKDSEAIVQFNEAINRVIAISLVHEKMYQTSDLSNINIENYLNEIGREIIQSSPNRDKIQLNITVEIKKIKLKPIIPFALIFNELISNSIKHNTHKDGILEIKVKLTIDNNDTIHFDYSDNGDWVENKNENSFGLDLINALTMQINGKLTHTISPVTNFYIEFQNIS